MFITENYFYYINYFKQKYFSHSLQIKFIIISLLILIIVHINPLFRTLEYYILDLRFKLRGELKQNNKIVMIEITKDTLKDLKCEYPIKRTYHASMINILNHFGVKSIVYDIIFMKESRETSNDIKLKNAIIKAKNVYLPFSFDGLSKNNTDNLNFFKASIKYEIFEEFKKAIKATGHINYLSYDAGKLRKFPLFINYKNKLFPHLCFKVVYDYLGLNNYKIIFTKNKNIQIKNKKNNELKYNISMDKNGQIYFNWAGKWDDTFVHYSFGDIIKSVEQIGKGIKPRIPIEKLNNLKDKICFIGVTEFGMTDIHPISFQERYPGVGSFINICNMFLNNSFIKKAPKVLVILISIFFMILSFQIHKLFSLKVSPLILLVISLLYISLSLFLFVKFNVILDIINPIFLLILGSAITLIYKSVRFKNQLNLNLSFDQQLSLDIEYDPDLNTKEIDQYKVIEEIGRGGMAIVFKVSNLKTKEIFALKIISPKFSDDTAFRMRFKREAKSLMKIDHPNVIKIFELQRHHQGMYYYVMEYFEGKDLRQKFIEQGTFDEMFIIYILKQILFGLNVVHNNGVIHRDIKPGNILINYLNEIKITDFGLARPINEENIVTTIGQTLGTPVYSSPEQLLGEKILPSSDLYSLGIVMYELIMGELPFNAESIVQLSYLKSKGKIPHLKSKFYDVSDNFNAIISKMLAPKLEDRYENAMEVLSDLEGI